MIDPDERPVYDFGVLAHGEWDDRGVPTGWTIDCKQLAYDLPRWLLNEPVLRLSEGPSCCVYLRGCYSERLTRERKEAVLDLFNAVAAELG